MRVTYVLVALAVLTAVSRCEPARAGSPYWNHRACYQSNYGAFAYQRNWHGDYFHTGWGTPIALVVPPTAGRQTKWSWGVTNTEVVPLWHQFGRSYPGPYAGSGAGFLPTPLWPSHTDQFGVYSVRGPW